MPPLLEVADFAVHRAEGSASPWSIALPSLRLRGGEVAALHGPSGCGKTTLIQALFGLLPRDAGWSQGQVRYRGRALAELGPGERRELLRREIVYLAQDAEASLDPLQPVVAQICQASGCRPEAAVKMLRQLGIEEAAALGVRLPHQLSGGQAQRVLLAIAFLRTPALVVADEPSASLDGGSYAELAQQLRRLVKNGSAVLLASHDERLLYDLRATTLTWSDGVFRPGRHTTEPWPQRSPADRPGAFPALTAHGISVAFGARVVLDELDFVLHRSEIVAILGESGAGKTTLARVLAGHRPPDRGHIERPERRAAVQLLAQHAMASLTPGRTLRSLLDEAKAPLFDCEVMADELHLPLGLLERSREQLSGGERRRAALLRALAVLPDVLLLDEPTAALDRPTGIAVVQQLLQLQHSRGFGLVLITHDLTLAKALAHRVLTLEGGRLCEV